MLRLRHFRNLAPQELTLPAEGVAIVSPNARGKSNLVEAIYYLETFRSFRGARDAQLVGFQADAFHVRGVVRDESDTELEIGAAYERSSRRKRVTLDGVPAGRLGDALGRVAAVVFSPSDVGLVSDGPHARRRFLDIVLSLNAPGYLDALQRYRHALAQRNAALKSAGAQQPVDVWDAGLVEAGSRVMDARRAWVERWAERFACLYATVSGGARARLTYAPSVAGLDADAFGEALEAAAARDRKMRTTTVGPHRDDLRIALEGAEPAEAGGARGGMDLRDYGSGGQRRTAALALRLVEAETVRAARGTEPLVLMDDVFAELDDDRSARLLAHLEAQGAGQVVLTAPKEADVRLRRDRLPRWRIEDGRVLEA